MAPLLRLWYHALSNMAKRNIEQELINGAITHNFLAAADPVSRVADLSGLLLEEHISLFLGFAKLICLSVGTALTAI